MATQLADWKLGGNGQAVAVAIPGVTANHCPVDCDVGPPPAESVAAADVVAAVAVASVPAFQSETKRSANPNKGQTSTTAVETGCHYCAGDPVAG